MNSLGAALVWGVAQVTLFALAGALVYALARRRGPASGALAALGTLMGVIAISALVASPWPRWWAPSTQGASTDRGPDPATAVLPEPGPARNADTGSGKVPLDVAAKSAALAPNKRAVSTQGLWQATWETLLEDLEAAPHPVPAKPAWRWPALAALVALLGMALGLARLALGVAGLTLLRRRSRLVTDPDLLDLLAILRAELVCTQPIEVRESARLGAPATFGWRRPLILLPLGWRSWDAIERQVVLAHEVAHIGRGDYGACLLAHLGVALHFFNPLVHWLVSRLRIEQELVADGCAAVVSGGREQYLVTLAQMALRLDRRGVSWGARPFLPTRETFLRRIQMLRDANPLPSRAPASWARGTLLGTLGILGVLVAGLRGPGAGDGALARSADDALEAKATADSDLTYVPDDALALAVIRPAQLARNKNMDESVKVFNELTHIEGTWGLGIRDLDEVQFVVVDINASVAPAFAPCDRLVLHSVKAHDWAKSLRQVAPDAAEQTFQGKKYLKPARGTACYYLPDERTLIVATENQVKRVIDAAGQGAAKPDWAAAWQRMATGPVALMVDTARLRQIIAAATARNEPRGAEAALVAAIGPLWEQADRVFLGAKLEPELAVQGLAQCPSVNAAEKVQKTAQAAATIAANGLTQVQKELSQHPTEETPLLRKLVAVGEDLLASVQVEHMEKTVQLRAHSDKAGAVVLLAPAVIKIREASNRTRSANNLKQIALAMHNYHDVHGHFPPATIIGPDGTTPHSWRVELLPFLEQDNLYKSYKMNEGWDSPANRKILAQMPDLFRAPGSDPQGTNACYFVLTGGGSMFSKKEGTRLADITDGTSNTLMLVEAKRDIPWTKPEDIPYDPNKPLPKLGGYFDNGFNAALADGSVRFLPYDIKENTLRALISMAGGEVIEGF
jgi:beta-lactamase regulating signal transducer with metallopeptidase domain